MSAEATVDPANGTATDTAREMTYLEAISDALREEMRRDETVFCLGEDIGAFGGAFKITDGFIESSGPTACSTLPSRRTRSSAQRSEPPPRGYGRSARCSSRTSSRAGSTSS